MKTIKEEWEIFRQAVVPITAGGEQVSSMQMAFYGGASIMLAALIDLTGKGKTADRKSFNTEFVAIMNELSTFAEEKMGVTN